MAAHGKLTTLEDIPESTMLLKVTHVLTRHPGLTRAELADHAGMSRATVSAALRTLRERGALKERVSSRERPPMGRPPTRVSLVGPAASAVGLEITHEELRAGVFDISGRTLAETRVPITRSESVVGLLDKAEALVRFLIDQRPRGAQQVLGLGVAVPAPIDGDGNVVEDAGLSQLAGVDLVRELQRRTGLAVSAENHANAAATAEHRFGAGRGCAELLYLQLVPGVGAGLILGNRLYRGACGTAGEIGHVTVDPRGASCGCGSRGCLATAASLTALERQVQPLTTSAAFDNWVRLAGLGEHRICRLITDTGILAGTAVASTFMLLDPERVVVGGRLAQAEPMLFDAIAAGISSRAARPVSARARLVRGAMGSKAAILGAASLQISHRLSASSEAAAVA